MNPNVAMIRSEGVRIIYGPIPGFIRKDIYLAVKQGLLGRLMKDGLRPEAFFHPGSRDEACRIRDEIAMAGVRAIAKICTRGDEE